MLTAILELDEDEVLDEVIVTKNEIMPDTLTGKVSKLDLNVKVNDKQINVEIQLMQHDDYPERVLFYWSRLFSGSAESGERYKDIPQTISLNVLGYTMFSDIEDYHTKFMVMDTQYYRALTDKLSIQFFELPKLRKRKKNLADRKERWLRFLDAETEEELDMLEKEQDHTLNKAITKLRYFSTDEQMRLDAISREKAIRDESAYWKEAWDKGIAEGRVNERNDIISKMKKIGLTDEMISNILNA